MFLSILAIFFPKTRFFDQNRFFQTQVLILAGSTPQNFAPAHV